MASERQGSFQLSGTALWTPEVFQSFPRENIFTGPGGWWGYPPPRTATGPRLKAGCCTWIIRKEISAGLGYNKAENQKCVSTGELQVNLVFP